MPMWLPEQRCRPRGTRPVLPATASKKIVMNTLPSLKNWRNAAMKRQPDCAAGPRVSVTPWKKWIPFGVVSIYCLRVRFPTAYFFCAHTYPFFHDAEAWPESEEVAYAAVAQSRADKAAAGGAIQSETDV